MERLKDDRWVKMPIEKLVKADWNYKDDDPDKAAKLAANIKRNGQVENLMIRELPTGFYEVLNGNHRLDVFTELEMDTAICFNFGKISLAHAQRLAIELNETRFPSNNLRLGQLIKEMGVGAGAEFSLEEMAETMPFTGDELRSLVDLVDFDWSRYDKDKEPDPPPPGPGDEMEGASSMKIRVVVECPKCHHHFLVKNDGHKDDKGNLVGEHENDEE